MTSTLEIPISILRKSSLTVEEYLILEYISNNKPIESLKDLLLNFDLGTERLQKNGFLKITDLGLVLRDKGKALFVTNDTYFLEFWNSYPLKVPGQLGAPRMLRTASADTEMGKKIKKKYESIVKGKKPLHDKIMACLDIQKDVMRHNLKFFQNIDTYLNQRTWEKYEHLISSPKVSSSTESEENDYGQKLI